MSDAVTLEELLGRHYAARVMGYGNEAQAMEALQFALDDPEFYKLAQDRLSGLEALDAHTQGNLQSRDFCGHIARIALRQALGVPTTGD